VTVFDLDPLLRRIEQAIQRHALAEPGLFARWTIPGAGRDLGPNAYGCADAVNLMYTLGCLPREAAARAALVSGLERLQDPATGLFREATHHEIHTTAHCVAALELLDARPDHPLAALARLARIEAVEPFLEALDWKTNPWIEAHRGAGLYAALVLTEGSSSAWGDCYFDWLERAWDPVSGLLRRGCVPAADAGPAIFPHLAGTFHYLFNLEHARRPLPHAAALVDTCLEIHARASFPLAHYVGFAEIDWVYCLSRALRQSGHRFAEARAALIGLAGRQVRFLESLDPLAHDGFDDLHALFGATCALAELQSAVPGLLRSSRPLRLVLDRRPFI
jgi:hypothetical protein